MPPVAMIWSGAPNRSCDVTSHVALDACAAAGEKAGASWTVLTNQRTALELLGVRRSRPPRELAHDDPPAYVRALSAVGELAELSDPDGLGAEGVNLLQANGAIAFQTVFHFHIHVLPRYRGDGFRLEVRRQPGDEAVMDSVASLYRRGLDG